MEREGSVTVVLGLQRGDEGKGRFVDALAEEHQVVARFNSGPNAGHTVVLPNGEEFDLHLMPSGIAHPDAVNVIGSGCSVDPIKLASEIDTLNEKGIDVTPKNLKLSADAHFILPHHIEIDAAHETTSLAQGTTKAGIWPSAADKYSRTGMRVASVIDEKKELSSRVHKGLEEHYRPDPDDSEASSLAKRQEIKQAFMRSATRLGEFVTDTSIYVNDRLRNGSRVLAEGAQAFLLDIDHGMYPDVTSSSTTIGGVMTGLGIAPRYIDRTIGVIKSTQSHVGGGPFVTEIHDQDLAARLRGTAGDVDAEFGTTTGRARRMGNIDLPQIRRAIMINGVGELALTKLDCLPRYEGSIPVCTDYEFEGMATRMAPGSANELKRCEPIYKNLLLWEEDIQGFREFEHLPRVARDYVKFLQDQLATPITMIGVGPRRDQVILNSL